MLPKDSTPNTQNLALTRDFAKVTRQQWYSALSFHVPRSIFELSKARKLREITKVAPSAIQLVVKTHKITIYLLTPLSAVLSDLKAETLSALSQFSQDVDDIPQISSEDDFELCRKEVPTGPRGGGGPIKYVVLDDGSKSVKHQGLVNWQILYLRLRVNGRLILQRQS